MSQFSRRQLAAYAAENIGAGRGKELVNEIAAYLVETGRVKEVDLLVRDIEQALQSQGVVVAHVGSAYPLDETSRQQIETLLKNQFAAQKTALSETIDSGLIGGVTISAGGDEFDGSIRRKINQLKNA